MKPGDQVVAINGYRIGRNNLWRMEYAFNVLRPLAQLTLTLRNPQGEERKAELVARFRQRARMRDLDYNNIARMVMEGELWEQEQRIQTQEYGGDLLIAKVPSFMFEEGGVGRLIALAQKHKTLVLDLRGNPGGDLEVLRMLTGCLFENDVKLGEQVGRSSRRPLVLKANSHPYTGKLIVLIDSKSASAAELLARVVQLEKRGTVIGDRSAGAVMEAREFGYSAGMEIVTFFGASITDADIVMTDGKSLEHVGVTPDEVMLPTGDDLGHGRDPVLAHAAKLAGVELSRENAGKLFPHQWPDDK